MINRITKGWHVARIIRLLLGGWLTYFSAQEGEKLLLILGIWLVIQALFNLSYCAMAGSCGTSKGVHPTKVYSGEIKTYDPNKK